MVKNNRHLNWYCLLIPILLFAWSALSCHDSTNTIQSATKKPRSLELCGNGIVDWGTDEMCEVDAHCGTDFERRCINCTCVPRPNCGNGVIDEGEQCEIDDDCPQGPDNDFGLRLTEQVSKCAHCMCVGTGDVRVTLVWYNANDLDLHVIEPSGEEVFYGNPVSATGGILDWDYNPGCSVTGPNPIENIFWPTGLAPHGTYTVKVNYYEHCGGEQLQTRFTVETFVDGVSTLYNRTASRESSCYHCDEDCYCELVTRFTR